MKRIGALRWPWMILLLSFVVLIILGARAHPLWGDEAETALFGRNILTYGIPKGWDGVNIMGINNAVVLDKNLVNHTSPWAQYYLVAASFFLFGQSSVTARIPAVLLAIATIPLLYALAIRLTQSKRIALTSAFLLSISVPYLLFSYQARYYSLVTLMALLMTYVGLRLREGRKREMLVFILAGIVFFYGNYVIFGAFFLALCLSFFLYHRLIHGVRGLGTLAGRLMISCAAIAAATIPWVLLYKPSGSQGDIVIPGFVEGVRYFFEFLKLAILPYHNNNAFPLGMWMLWGIVLAERIWRRKAPWGLMFPIAVVVFFLSVMAASTVVGDVVTSFVHSRYTTLVLPFFALAAAMVIDTIWRWRRTLGIGLIVVFGFTSLLAFQPRILLAEYLREMVWPYETPDRVVAQYLLKNAKDGDTAFVNLDRDHEPLIFHLGKKIRFVNRVSLINTRIFPENRGIIPRYIYDFRDNPDWIILYSKRGNDGSFLTFDERPLPPQINLARDYEETVLPVFFADMSRPEFELRSFRGVRPTYQDQVFLYKKK